MAKKNQRLLGKEGSTMIETLVAVVVVMLVMGMFSRVVSVSSRLLHSAQKTIEKDERFDAFSYRTDVTPVPVAKGMTITEQGGSGGVSSPYERIDIKGCEMKKIHDGAGTGLSLYKFYDSPTPEPVPSTTP